VLVGARVAELLGQAEVDDVDEVALLGQAHQEVVGLDVAVDEVFRVDVFDAADLHAFKLAKLVLLLFGLVVSAQLYIGISHITITKIRI